MCVLISGELYVRADMPTLKAVASFVPELSARVSDFLRKQVRVRAEVARPQTQPDARPAQTSSADQKSSDPAPIADGPRGGVDAWNRHGQPVPSEQETTSQGTTSVDAPITAWEVAPIPQDSEDSPADLHPDDAAERQPAASSQSVLPARYSASRFPVSTRYILRGAGELASRNRACTP